MKLKNVEHEGTEEFVDFPDRVVHKKFKEDFEKRQERLEAIQKLKEQEKWLSPENPYLWTHVDGEFDD